MNKLIINTANDKLFIVLQKEDNVFCKLSESKMHHNETMLPLIDKILKDNNIDIKDINKLGVVIGPGSFTGIRVGIATIKAFRDSLGVQAKGINNLDYLFALAKSKDEKVTTVAIKGSKDSYFVAKLINGVVYKYDRNLSLDELKNVAENSKIAMFNDDENVDCFAVQDDAFILLDCLKESEDDKLIPVYYQLSQAESEKFKRAEIEIVEAEIIDKAKIFDIEQNSIQNNPLSKNDVELALIDKNYKTFKAVLNGELVGFIILQITDEINVSSIAVKKEFRNLGLATKLLSRAQEFAKENNFKTLSLEVSYKNIKAFLLYNKFGFVERRIRKNYYKDGTDCIEMFKEV